MTDQRDEIARLRASGMGWHSVAQRLNRTGVPTPSGRGQWWAASVEHYYYPRKWADYVWCRRREDRP